MKRVGSIVNANLKEKNNSIIKTTIEIKSFYISETNCKIALATLKEKLLEYDNYILIEEPKDYEIPKIFAVNIYSSYFGKFNRNILKKIINESGIVKFDIEN